MALLSYYFFQVDAYFFFFLQEPTSGLDNKTAFSLVKTLKHYTEGRNKTVVDICFLVTGTHIWARLQDCL